MERDIRDEIRRELSDPEKLRDLIRRASEMMELERVSRHEAAHAVAGHAMGARVDLVTVKNGGRTLAEWPRLPSRHDAPMAWRNSWERLAAYALAGQFADDPDRCAEQANNQPLVRGVYQCVIGEPEVHDHHDLAKAARAAREILPYDEMEAIRYLEMLASNARKFLYARWPMVEAVAERLREQETLSGDAVRQIIAACKP